MDYQTPIDVTPANAISQEERMWAMLCHLGSFAFYVFPFGNLLVPLIIWMVKRDTMPFVREQGKEALNFQITLMLYLAVIVVLCFVLIGFALLIALPIYQIVMTILASIKVYDGDHYRYPFILRLI